jgi:reductive dehalogenase
MPEHSPPTPPPATPTERVDERDTLFARMARRPGTAAFDDTYARRPELRADDDRLRALPALCTPGGRYYEPERAAEADRLFESIPGLQPDAAEVDRLARALSGAANPTTVLRRAALDLGAVAAGCTPVAPAFVYSHKGRFDADYGRSLATDLLPHAVVFLVEMDHAAMRCAPAAPTIVESARQYVRAARISTTLAAALRAAGRAGRSQHDAHYEVLLPPLAVQAGLGELGRNNILVADRFGSRVRIGAVTTDLPLAPAAPLDLGVRAFCAVCRKCAENCPAHALSAGPPVELRGIRKWPTAVERCYGFWRGAGTDCGICMAVCPFSHRDTWPHRLVRSLVRRARWTHRAAVWFDDRLYGRRWRGGPRFDP